MRTRNFGPFKAFVAADEAFEKELVKLYGEQATRYRYGPESPEPFSVCKARMAFHAAAEDFYGPKKA